MNTIWKPYNSKAIISNVNLVFKTKDINKLNGPAYKFISLYHGFIAHYNLYGFRDTYDGKLTAFAKGLLSSEMNRDLSYNEHYATRRAAGGYDDQGGALYQKSVVLTMRGIMNLAKKYLQEK